MCVCVCVCMCVCACVCVVCVCVRVRATVWRARAFVDLYVHVPSPRIHILTTQLSCKCFFLLPSDQLALMSIANVAAAKDNLGLILFT